MKSHELFRPLTLATIFWLSLTAQDTWAQEVLAASVLPTSRSVQVGNPATAFATIINPDLATATQCSIAPASVVPASFRYQTTDAATNALTGSANTPVDIPPGGSQSFVVAFTPTAAFAPTDVEFTFDCTNTDPAPSLPGVNSLLLSASDTPVADIIALAVTASGDGIVNLPSETGSAAFALASASVGADAGLVSISASALNAGLPVTTALCETNPATGQCLSLPSFSLSKTISANDTASYAVFVTGSGAIPFDPANNRIVVEFQQAGGVVRGRTSVAVRVNRPPTAVNDGFTVEQDTSLNSLDVLSNDTDPDLPAETLTITSVGTPSAGGTVTNQGTSLAYTPLAGFTGTETFTYTVEDSTSASSSATVTMTVNASGGSQSAVLAHYWRLDETSGQSYADAVGSAAATCTTCPTSVSGLIGQAAQEFNGVNDELRVANLTTVNWSANDSFTIEYWMKHDTACAGLETGVGRKDGQTSLEWWVGCDGGKARFQLTDRSGAGLALVGTTDIDDGNWHHVVAVRDGGPNENRLYVDGVLEDSAPVIYGDSFASTATLNIGWLDNNAGGSHFDGQLDEIAIHDGVVTDDEIARHTVDGSVGLQRGYLGCTAPVRIMPLGDSITARPGYRPPLWFDLGGASYDVDFVGSSPESCPDDPSQCSYDPDNEGHSGWTPDQIAASLNGFLGANPADVILLHIGTNDLDLLGVEDILNITDSFDPAITVVLARIINRMTFDQATTDFNIAVAAMAEQRISNGDKIIVVDMESALTYPDDMQDELHPLQVGFDKMAVVWRDSLSTFLPVCP